MNHTKIIGSLNLLIAALNLIGGIQFFIRGNAAPLLSAGAVTVLIVGTLALVAGMGLLMGRAWGRIPAFIVAAAVLIVIPVGTAFGIYAILMLRDPNVRDPLN